MNTPNTTEKHIQHNTIEILKAMGWTFISQEEMRSYRNNTNQVLLKDILFERLQAINGFSYKNNQYQFSSKNCTKAINDLDMPLDEGLVTVNNKITDKLLFGESYEEELSDGGKKSFTMKYIDYANIKNNHFHFTEEFSVDRQTRIEQEKTRRPDLVLFVNGIPIAVIELKKSDVQTSQGISQMIGNQRNNEIPQLFKFAQITLAGNNHTPKYGTVGTAKKFYSHWKEEKDISSLVKNRTSSPLDNVVWSLFSKDRCIDIMKNFILFDHNVKKITRYQQFFAVKKIMKRILRINNNGQRLGGLIWHTQGSGKSLTMVMLAKKIQKTMSGAKIIIVTDRVDLDKQIHETFKNTDIRAKKAASGHNLMELLQTGESVITTIINKFEKVKNSNLRIDDPNIFVLVDESHRTQGGDLHKAMKKVLTKACYLGFTGTPLMKKDKNTFKKFGGEIDRYTIDQAVEDKVVLPLLYEGRLVDQWISDEKGLDRRFDQISKNLNEEQILDLKKKWARFQRIASTERRLEMIMLDINEHFIRNVKGTGLKAILATNSRYEAIKYHQLFKELGNIKTAFVISKINTRERNEKIDEDNKDIIGAEWDKVIKKYGGEDTFLDRVKDEFVNGEELELLIVVNKFLTGFDAPRATYLYLDKEIRDHSLLQAIARVNRIYEGKEYGFIIDYRGLFGALDKALSDYSSLNEFDEDDIIDVVFDIKEAIAKTKTYYTKLEGLFASVKHKNDQESYQVYLADEKIRKEFYNYLSEYARALRITLSSDRSEEIFTDEGIKEFKSKMKFYAILRASVKIRYFESIDFGEYEPQMQKLLDTFISADEVVQITKTVDIFSKDFNTEIERLEGNNAKADAILSASSATITEKRDSNPAYYGKLSQRIEDILSEYKAGRLTEDEKLANARDIKEKLRNNENEDEEEDYPQDIQGKRFAKIIYSNVRDDFSKLLNDKDEIIKDFSLKVDEIFSEIRKKPDWHNNMDVKNDMERDLQYWLWDIEDNCKVKFDDKKIIDKVRSIGVSYYNL